MSKEVTTAVYSVKGGAKEKDIVLFSGGLDSATLLWGFKPQVKALSVYYKQRHMKELDAASAFCDKYKIEHEVVNLESINKLICVGSQAGQSAVPEGHYTADNMRATIVPNRNMIMLAVAVGWSQATGCSRVFYAAHAGDHHIYPDCRPEFVEAMRMAIYQSSDAPHTQLFTPFINMTKAGIVKLGLDLGVPYGETWSCYNGRERACGKCGTCVERLEAFHANGIPDPIEYEDRTFWMTATSSR